MEGWRYIVFKFYTLIGNLGEEAPFYWVIMGGLKEVGGVAVYIYVQNYAGCWLEFMVHALP